MYPHAPMMAAGQRAQFTTWNPSDKSASITLSNGNLTATTSAGAGGGRGTNGKSAGKWAFTINPTGTSIYLGIANTSEAVSNLGGGSLNSIVRNDAGSVRFNGSTLGGATISASAVNIFAFDLDAKNVWIFDPGAGQWNSSGTANPATGVGGYSFSSINAGPYYPWVAGGSAVSATLDAFPLASSLAGFSPWDIGA